ncbi:MAG: hypothetical protein Q9184_004158 [Pyrenodesmia sp. 2 TL-2023]
MGSILTDQLGVPNPVKADRGILFFKIADTDPWTRLDDGPVKNGFNIQKINFNYGIAFEQRNGQAKSRLTYTAENIGEGPLIENVADKDFEVTVPLVGHPSCRFEGAAAEAAAFPIAIQSPSWTSIKLRFRLDDVKKFFDRNAVRKPIVHHLTGNISSISSHSVGAWIQKTKAVLEAESAASKAAALSLDDCKIRTVAFGNLLAIAVWPNQDVSGDDQLRVASADYASQYSIADCNVFPEEAAKDHKAEGQEKAFWVFQVISRIPGLHAPIVGVVLNKFKNEVTKERFLDREEDHVTINRRVTDVHGGAEHDAVNDLRYDFEAVSGKFHDFVSSHETGERKIKLPVDALFLEFLQSPGDSNDTLVQRPANPPIAAKLNASQNQAVSMAFEHKVSFIHGPAATGKSSTLASLTMELVTSNPSERVLSVMTRNVAVDALLGRCVESANALSPKQGTIHPFVRLVSSNKILSQHLEGNQALKNPYHLDSKRVAWALRTGNTTFLHGRDKIINTGYIADEKEMRNYRLALKKVTRAVLDEQRVVFCTSSMCRSPALVWKETVNKEVITMTWKATTLIYDDLPCSNPPELLIPIATFSKTLGRVVGAGDHLQLKGFVHSDLAKEFWAKTIFERGLKAYPSTNLNENYRQHSLLANPVFSVVYQKENVKAFYQTQQPRPFLKKYLSLMPLSISDTSNIYQLQSFVHFVDVSHGIQEVSARGSKRNMAEIDVCVAIISTLFNQGLQTDDTLKVKRLGVITGYSSQVTALEERFKRESETDERWSRAHIVTVDSIQGEEFEICLVSLVATQDARGFVGEMQRANVLATRPREVMLYASTMQARHLPSSAASPSSELFSGRRTPPHLRIPSAAPLSAATQLAVRPITPPDLGQSPKTLPPPADTHNVVPATPASPEPVTAAAIAEIEQKAQRLSEHDEETAMQRREIVDRGKAELEALQRHLQAELDAYDRRRRQERESIQ